MFGKALIRLQDYASIISILISHLKQKWKDQRQEFIAFNLIILVGIVMSAISVYKYGHPETFVEFALFYAFVLFLSLFIISIRKKKLVINRVIYEIKYVGRMFTFMIECYHNIVEQYINISKEMRKYQHSVLELYDMIVIGTIFKKMFTMYFNAIAAKQKNPEPYLIDVQEMNDVYSSKEFNNFYSTLFFNVRDENGKSSYECVIIKILDEVMSQLYTKSWFVDNYNDEIVEDLIKYILNHWYDSVAQFESKQPITEAF